MSRLYIGCAIWGYPKWENQVFPAGTTGTACLLHYSKRYSCVEGNTTFYAVPSAQLLAEWYSQSAADFEFLLKIPRKYSHQGDLKQQLQGALEFYDHCAAHLKDKLGPMFLQLPPSYTAAKGPDLSFFLNGWRAHTNHALAVEFRHSSWFCHPNQQRVNHMLERMGLPRVIMDSRPAHQSPTSPCKKPLLPVSFALTSKTAFIRYISHPQIELNHPYIEEWSVILKQYQEDDITVYFFIHCPEEEHTPTLSKAFYNIMREAGVNLPPPRWESAPSFLRQQSLF